MAARIRGNTTFCQKFQLKAGFMAKTGPLHSSVRLGKNLLNISGRPGAPSSGRTSIWFHVHLHIGRPRDTFGFLEAQTWSLSKGWNCFTTLCPIMSYTVSFHPGYCFQKSTRIQRVSINCIPTPNLWATREGTRAEADGADFQTRHRQKAQASSPLVRMGLTRLGKISLRIKKCSLGRRRSLANHRNC